MSPYIYALQPWIFMLMMEVYITYFVLVTQKYGWSPIVKMLFIVILY